MNRLIIYLKKDVLSANLVDVGKSIVKDTYDVGWDSNTLDLALDKIIEKFKIKKVRVLLDDQYSYVMRIKLPPDISQSDKRQYLSSKISENIPELLGDNDWDYKEINFNIAKKDDVSPDKEVVVFSPVKSVLNILTRSIQNLGLTIEAIEPVEIAVTRNSNPIVGLATKEDVSGKDDTVLNIIIDQKKKDIDFSDIIGSEKIETESADNANNDFGAVERGGIGKSKNLGKKTLALIIIIFVILLITAIAAYYFFLKKDDVAKPIENNSTNVVVSPTEYPTPTIEIPDLSVYKFEILNGSGKAGEAQNAKILLEESGFSDFTLGNADSFNYVQTMIEVNENVSQEIIDEVMAALEQKYEVATQTAILTNSNFDLRIILGDRNL